jgi:hypothetical protein
MSLVRSSIVAFLVLIPSFAEAAISGTYVGSGADIAVLLQLVESNGGQLSGRYEQQKLVSGNRIEQLNASVSGTSDGQTIVLQVRPTEVLAGTYVLSGTISGSVLQINGGGYGQTFHLNLTRATEDEFRTRAANIATSANRAVATQTLEADLETSEHTLDAMSKFSANPEPRPSAFIPYEQRYRTLTQAMRAALGRQQSIPRFIQTPVRGQIGVAINQAAIETGQIHDEVKSQEAELKQKILKALAKIAPIGKRCEDVHAQVNIAPQALEKLKSQCARIPQIAKQFGKDVQQIAKSFERIEVVWREEQEKQQAIVRSADFAAR